MQDVKYNLLENVYAYHSLYFLAYMVAKLFKNREVQVKMLKGSVKLAHNLMAAGLFAEFKLLPKKLTGTSIFCIASKTG